MEIVAESEIERCIKEPITTSPSEPFIELDPSPTSAQGNPQKSGNEIKNMVSKPTLVLVPGSFTPATGYDPLAEAFAAKGYSIKVLDLRTVGKKPGTPPTMYDDAAYINSEVAKLADEGKEVVLVAHSYGGIPTSESLKGVSKEAREKEGKKGGVVRVAYLTALVPEVGTGAGAVMEGQRMDYNELDAVCVPGILQAALRRTSGDR